MSTNSQRGSGVGSATRGCFIIGSSIPAYINTIEYITLTTSGEASDFGDATSNAGALNNNSASNTIRGAYHIGRSTPGGSVLNTIDYITIATTGNAQDFGDLSYVTRSGCGLSDSHGGLSY